MVFGETDPQHHRIWQSVESLEFVQKPQEDSLIQMVSSITVYCLRTVK